MANKQRKLESKLCKIIIKIINLEDLLNVYLCVQATVSGEVIVVPLVSDIYFTANCGTTAESRYQLKQGEVLNMM